MADITKALAVIFGHEGGFTEDPDDNGNWTGGKPGAGILKGTKFGISAASYPNEDIKGLTLERAGQLYGRDFWSPLRLSEINNQTIATEIFDTAVNCGAGTAAMIAQKSVNMTNYPDPDIVVDGNIGPATIAAINSHRSPKSYYKALNGFQFMHYEKIWENDPRKEKYMRSWLSRVFEAEV
jgi:lysozyme family protein